MPRGMLIWKGSMTNEHAPERVPAGASWTPTGQGEALVCSRILLTTCLLMVHLTITASNASAQMATSDRCVVASDVVVASLALSLHGLPGVRVVVSDQFRSGRDSLLADELRSQIASMLKRAGIRVVSTAGSRSVPGHPTLSFDANRGVSLVVREDASLTRRPDIHTTVENYRVDTSYDGGFIEQPIQFPPMADADSIRATVENRRNSCRDQELELIHDLAAELTGMFVQAYLQENPQRPVKKKPPN